MIDNPDISAVVVSNRAHTKSTTGEQAAGMIQPMLDAGKQVAVVTDVPGLEGDLRAPDCVERSAGQADPCSWVPDERNAKNYLVDAAGILDLPVIDLRDRVCSDDGVCHTVIGGTIAYSDNHHLSVAFSHTLGPWFSEQLAIATPE